MVKTFFSQQILVTWCATLMMELVSFLVLFFSHCSCFKISVIPEIVLGISSATKNTTNGCAKSNMTGRTSKILIKYKVGSKAWKMGIIFCWVLWKHWVPIECKINQGSKVKTFSAKIVHSLSETSFLEAAKYPGSKSWTDK